MSLFEAPDDDTTTAARAVDQALETRRARGAALAKALPQALAFGTSSWTFPGWAGLVYPSGLSTTALGREGLRHYACHPLLRTVGVDRSYYAPIPLDDLRGYASQLPAGFRCCVKAPASVTPRLVPAFGGARAVATDNSNFFSVGRSTKINATGFGRSTAWLSPTRRCGTRWWHSRRARWPRAARSTCS